LRGASTKWDRLCESGDETPGETHVVIDGFTPRGGEWIGEITLKRMAKKLERWRKYAR
jgi:hypothetical protein